MGYYRAGFTDITGIDNRPMPRYPFRFIQADALEYLAEHGHEYDVIHASPPCQAYTQARRLQGNREHPDLIVPVRDLLAQTGKPWIIENVPGAPIRGDLMLCGTMFGLKIIRHRYFELSWPANFLTMTCNHRGVYDPWHGTGRTANKFREAIGIDWMPVGGGTHKQGSIDEAVPPAYTEWIGKQLMQALKGE